MGSSLFFSSFKNFNNLLKNILFGINFFSQERSGFLDQAEKAIKLQMEAQETAEKAIQQLEDFINEDSQIVLI